MDFLKSYGDSDEEEDSNNVNNNNKKDDNTISNNSNSNSSSLTGKEELTKEFKSFKPSSSLAPSVKSIRVLDNKIDPKSKVLTYNPTVESLYGNTEGPEKPFTRSTQRIDSSLKNHKGGIVQDYFIDDHSFNEQFYTFKSFGYANDLNSGRVVGDVNKHTENSGATVFNNNDSNGNNKVVGEKKKKKREFDDPSDIKGYQGPWAAKEHEIELKNKLAQENQQEITVELSVEQKAYLDMRNKQSKRDKEESSITAVFYGKDKKDYMGRSWVEPATDIKPDVISAAFLPKRLVHTWTGHTKGVSAIRFFPRYGHLLLSASMDSSIRIWDVNNDRSCMQSYHGHVQAVRDISFTNDGRRFLSASYDRNTRLWDTETGQIIATYNTGRIPYVVKFNPDEDKQNQFLAGGSDKKILQYDTKSGEIVQTYDQHLGAVNTITFIDDNRRFVSSSDDKSLRVWDWGIPVVIKYISEPDMHSMPAVALHPNGKEYATQSMDNQILVYSARDKLRMNKKKRFMGHMNAGYAIQLGFSPDGQYLCSGDSSGKAFFWDWKTSKCIKSMKAHDDVCIGIEWHPLETSKVATCGWDGKIKYWD